MTSRDDLRDGEEKIEQFLTHLAVKSGVASSTQNQAMNALGIIRNSTYYSLYYPPPSQFSNQQRILETHLIIS